jgi:hypothetical protein
MVFFRGTEVDVYAETEIEARNIAIPQFILQLESELQVIEVKPRTARCDICQYTYAPSDVTSINGEQLCTSCNWDKYQYQDEDISLADIPF